MELPDDAPKTPKLYFIAGDVLLIAVAVLIAFRSGTPLPAAAIYAITGCVMVGAVLLVLPFLLDYNRRQDMLLTERQNALEALVRTTSSAIEQASIATSGLNEIAELAQKNLRLAEQLPQKLHERVNEFKAVHDEAMAAELESLQQEVNTLRASEAEKLEAAADKVQRSAAELAKLDATVRKQLSALDEAARRAEQLITHAAAQAVREVEQGLARARRDPASASPQPAPVAPPAAAPVAPAPSAPLAPPPKPPPGEAPPRVVSSAELHPPPAPAVATALAPTSTPEAPARKAAVRRTTVETAPPLFAGLRNDAAPLEGTPERAPDTQPPFSMTARPSPDESTQLAPDEAQPEPALSSDGQTRLVVTAYIGIGNKLFLRGDGPGLSWDRGVPLQFVSIGKWRWETSEATRPISLKLYKNDQVECTAVGAIQLRPGHQRELTAAF